MSRSIQVNDICEQVSLLINSEHPDNNANGIDDIINVIRAEATAQQWGDDNSWGEFNNFKHIQQWLDITLLNHEQLKVWGKEGVNLLSFYKKVAIACWENAGKDKGMIGA